ncbi:MAG TPA: hypothetical protein VLT51_10860 [Anaerolineales bacterium]|nr:hypothetical protein [Anaerolineales bacterium]
MKKFLLTLLTVIVIVGALAGAGFTGYRIGYNQAATSSDNVPFFGPFGRVHPNLMPLHGFGRDFGPGFNSYRSPMMGRGGFGISVFSPFHFLWNAVVLALVIWFVYWLFTKSGWHITRQTGKDQEISPAKTEG